MTDLPPRGGSAGNPATLGDLFLGGERHASLAPKLAALLAQFRRLEELEDPDIEPAPPMPERWDGDEPR